MKVVALVSGGKDSCFAMMRCIDYNHQIVALANLLPLDDSVDELDSYMYQTVGHQIVVSYAECMGLPLFRRRIKGSTRHQDLGYKVTPGDEVEDMFILLNEVKRQIPSVDAVSSGAIASDYQRLRVESVCSRLGLVSLAYMWRQDQTFLLEEMMRRGIVAITIKVAAMGLIPAKHLGKELSELQPYLLDLKERYGINVCGEGGEYETLTLDCPLFTKARIVLDKFQIILHSPDSIAPVGVLHPLAFHLEHKLKMNSYTNLEEVQGTYEVHGDALQNCIVKCLSMNLNYDFDSIKKPYFCISASKKCMFSVGCWIQGSSKTTEDMKEDLTIALAGIDLQLKKDSFEWANVLYIHLYISDMKQFAVANETYVKFITEQKCYMGVPSRSTIELPLFSAGLGNAYVEVLVSKNRSKRVLHVQSISCWAPSCIGPYSQATLHKEILYMAGQLGLDPPTMSICSGGASAEVKQATENCEAVANCFNSSISTSTIILVIYCSASLTFSEKTEIQTMVDHSFGKRAPIFLYVLASQLPKGALVEIKPVMYVQEIDAGEDGLIVIENNTETTNCWGFRYSDWHDSCCQVYIIPGKICAALVSITKNTARRVCPENDEKHANGHHCFVKISKLCIYLLDEIIFRNHFSWDDLQHLIIYYAMDHIVESADSLYISFSEALKEFSKLTNRIEMFKEPIFSVVPVLASGKSASMEDIITCELFATKS